MKTLKPLRFIKSGDIITRHTRARYEVIAVFEYLGITWVAYYNKRSAGSRPKVNSIQHLKEWEYEIE